MTADADRPADVRDLFPPDALLHLEGRLRLLFGPEDAGDAADIALAWLGATLAAAGLTIVPAGEREWGYRFADGGGIPVRSDRETAERIVRRTGTARLPLAVIQRHVSPWQPADPDSEPAEEAKR